MIMAAARAGGIIANNTNQKDFFLENIEIQNTLLLTGDGTFSIHIDENNYSHSISLDSLKTLFI